MFLYISGVRLSNYSYLIGKFLTPPPSLEKIIMILLIVGWFIGFATWLNTTSLNHTSRRTACGDAGVTHVRTSGQFIHVTTSHCNSNGMCGWLGILPLRQHATAAKRLFNASFAFVIITFWQCVTAKGVAISKTLSSLYIGPSRPMSISPPFLRQPRDRISLSKI